MGAVKWVIRCCDYAVTQKC